MDTHPYDPFEKEMAIVLTVNKEKFSVGDALKALRQVSDSAPEGWSIRIYNRSSPEIDFILTGVPYGDLVEVIDVPKPGDKINFTESDLYARQKELTKGMFTNMLFLYMLTDDTRGD